MSATMRYFYGICAAFFCIVHFTDGLACGEVECPPEALTCSVKYAYANNPRRNITTVDCFNSYLTNVLRKSYETPLTEALMPMHDVECGGYKCKPGAFNCTTLTTPYIHKKPPMEITHLICRDDEGKIIEERDFVKELSESEAKGVSPSKCEGYTCPPGSRSCTYDTLIHLEPYKKTTRVKCFDIKKRITADVVLNA